MRIAVCACSVVASKFMGKEYDPNTDCFSVSTNIGCGRQCIEKALAVMPLFDMQVEEKSLGLPSS